jgi:hypothetical protein
MEALLSFVCAASPLPTLLSDTLTGPVDCSFLLYHFLGCAVPAAVASTPPATAASSPQSASLIVTCRVPSHHRALLRKCLGPARSEYVSLVCVHEVSRRLAASCSSASPASPEALAGALLGACSGGSGLAHSLWLAVEDVQGLCEAAGGVEQGFAVLQHLAAARPRGFLVRAEGACDWVLDGGCAGLLVAPTLGLALQRWAHTVVTGSDLPSGFSRDAHGKIEVWRKAGGGPSQPELGGLSALFKVSPDGAVTDPSAGLL